MVLQTYRHIGTIWSNSSTKVIKKLSKYKDLEIKTTRMGGMRTETVPVIVGALGLIREGMDQNLGKLPGASNINKLEKTSSSSSYYY